MNCPKCNNRVVETMCNDTTIKYTCYGCGWRGDLRKPRVLITGITGFVGSHLADYILDNKLGEVYGIKRWRSPMDNIEHIKDKIEIYDADLTDLSSMIATIAKIQPDRIAHLAAQSYVQSSYVYPNKTYQDNIIGTSNLLEAVRILKLDPFIHICSSSEVYGQVNENEVPITENQPLRPVSPYAVSKVTEDMLGYMYHQAYGMNIVRTRLFTHTGARRGEVFCESSFAKQVALIEKGKRDVIMVGNLNSIRTWLDVKDAVRAYWLLPQCPAGEVYNIGGDYTCTVGEMLRMLLDMATIREIGIVEDKSRLRPADVTRQIPSSEKFRKATGWSPSIPFYQTMSELLNYWRERV